MKENIAALQLFEQGLSKTQISIMATSAVESVKETGKVLQVVEALSAMELFIKEVKDSKEFKDYAREEIVKYPKAFISESGAKIEAIEAGVKYDFSNCGDNEYFILDQKLLSAKNALKDRETFLKTVPEKGLVITDINTGETCQIFPPSKTSISTYKVTLAK